MAILKKFRRIATIGIAVLSLTTAAFAALANDGITLEIINIESTEGTLRVAIYDNQDNYEKGLAYRVVSQSAVQGTTEIVLAKLPQGQYGVMLYQDINGNEKLDMNLLGIPKEPWSGSLLGRSVIGRPGWYDIIFKAPDAGNRIVIDMQ